jgi:acyl-coenzyme A synthetase/AMP-(fatty) acid ligase
MNIDFLIDVFIENKQCDAIFWNDTRYTYDNLLDYIGNWDDVLKCNNVAEGEVVILEADFSPNSIALFLSLIKQNCIIVPLTKSVGKKKDEYISIAQGQRIITIDSFDNVHFEKLFSSADHELYLTLKNRRSPGLILFSSGSTGKNKAVLHNLNELLEKFRLKKKKLRTMTFLLYDHIGGVNTMLYVLSNGGCIVTCSQRDPENVLRIIEAQKVELLPTSPTFLNLILISEAYKKYDLKSLKTITYGTEPMPEITLKRIHELFPDINLQQTYGLSELGILRSKSKSSNSLWVKIGGEGFEIRIAGGLLEIKARSAMLGYLNAPSPFTDDDWFMTGDQVEVDGEYIKILGRKSDIINVGGEKVYPAEVESVIMELTDIAEVSVYGEKNPITGQIVCAKVRANHEVTKIELVKLIKLHCSKKLQAYKVPVRITLSTDKQYSERFKKQKTI